MSEVQSGKTQKIWLMSAICGVIAFLALLFLANYTAGASAIVGVLVSALVVILLWIAWYSEEEVSAETEAKTTDTAVAEQPSAAEGLEAEVKPVENTELPQSEVAVTGVAPVETPALDEAQDVKDVEACEETTVPVKDELDTVAQAVEKAAIAKDGKPELLTAARAEGADDLKQIKGVGPKLEQRLNEIGFYHFDQIAGLRKTEVERLDKTLDAKGRIERDEWMAQAKRLASGEETDFSKRASKDSAL